MFRYVVLGLLHGRSPQHGYGLMKDYRARVGTELSAGNFYRELQRLGTEGLVQSVDRAADGDPRRAPYQITPEGAAAFQAWFVDPNARANGDADPISARLAFLPDVDPDAAIRTIEQWQDDLWVAAKTFERERAAAVRAAQGKVPPFDMLLLVHARRIRRIAADLAFLDDLRGQYVTWRESQQPTERAERETPAVEAVPEAVPKDAGRMPTGRPR